MTYDFVVSMEKKYLGLNHFEMSARQTSAAQRRFIVAALGVDPLRVQAQRRFVAVAVPPSLLFAARQAGRLCGLACQEALRMLTHAVILCSVAVPPALFPRGIWEVLEYLDTFVDDSDPDTDNSQMQHALQTAESIRRMYPEPEQDWFALVGLIHDIGKILAIACKVRNTHSAAQHTLAARNARRHTRSCCCAPLRPLAEQFAGIDRTITARAQSRAQWEPASSTGPSLLTLGFDMLTLTLLWVGACRCVRTPAPPLLSFLPGASMVHGR